MRDLQVVYVLKLNFIPITDGTLDSEMGPFGGPHRDLRDFCAAHSCGLCLSDLNDAPGCEPGRLHFLGLGIWWKLDYMSQLFFSGLLRHGGTAPLVPHDVEISGWEIRVNCISYPSTLPLTGEAKHPLCSEPYEEYPSYVQPEITGAPHPVVEDPGTNHANWCQDGWVGTGSLELLNFLARSLLEKSHAAMAQVPAAYRVEIDADRFLSAFSILVDDERVDADPWPYAPNRDVRNPFSERHREAQQGLLVKQFNRMMQCIPVVKYNKYEGWDITTRTFVSRPNRKCF